MRVEYFAHEAVLTTAGRTLRLLHVPSGSGAKYSDEQGNELLSQGEDLALLTLGGRELPECTRDGALPPAAARADDPDSFGSRFHARGNEPGWSADVRLGDVPKLRADTDYGQRRFAVDRATQTSEGWSGRTADGTPVSLRFEPGECFDDMSGERFSASAWLTVGSQTFRGCGVFER